MNTTELVAEREFDAMVAIRVMGWQRKLTEFNNEQYVVVPPDWTDFGSYWLGRSIFKLVPHYSTDIVAAWTVIEKMIEYEWSVNIFQNSIGPHVKFEREGFRTAYSTRFGFEKPDTVPLAVCLAALDAVEGS